MTDISASFIEADWKKAGVLPKIAFFVLWRNLEETRVRAGQVINVPSDKELGNIFELFDAFN